MTDTKSPLFDAEDFSRCCSSKKKYSTPYHAIYAIETCESADSRLRLRYYRCPYCGNYHLTQGK